MQRNSHETVAATRPAPMPSRLPGPPEPHSSLGLLIGIAGVAAVAVGFLVWAALSSSRF
jgi:hypothetical protein